MRPNICCFVLASRSRSGSFRRHSSAGWASSTVNRFEVIRARSGLALALCGRGRGRRCTSARAVGEVPDVDHGSRSEQLGLLGNQRGSLQGPYATSRSAGGISAPPSGAPDVPTPTSVGRRSPLSWRPGRPTCAKSPRRSGCRPLRAPTSTRAASRRDPRKQRRSSGSRGWTTPGSGNGTGVALG